MSSHHKAPMAAFVVVVVACLVVVLQAVRGDAFGLLQPAGPERGAVWGPRLSRLETTPDVAARAVTPAPHPQTTASAGSVGAHRRPARDTGHRSADAADHAVTPAVLEYPVRPPITSHVTGPASSSVSSAPGHGRARGEGRAPADATHTNHGKHVGRVDHTDHGKHLGSAKHAAQCTAACPHHGHSRD